MKTLLIIDAGLGQARAYMAKTLLGAAAPKAHLELIGFIPEPIGFDAVQYDLDGFVGTETNVLHLFWGFENIHPEPQTRVYFAVILHDFVFNKTFMDKAVYARVALTAEMRF